MLYFRQNKKNYFTLFKMFIAGKLVTSAVDMIRREEDQAYNNNMS